MTNLDIRKCQSGEKGHSRTPINHAPPVRYRRAVRPKVMDDRYEVLQCPLLVLGRSNGILFGHQFRINERVEWEGKQGGIIVVRGGGLGEISGKAMRAIGVFEKVELFFDCFGRIGRPDRG